MLGAAACAATVEDQRVPEDEVTAKELAAHEHRHFRGPVNVVIEAVRSHGNLSPEQDRALRTISSELEQDHASHRETKEQLRASAVAIVRSGTSSTAEFDQAVGRAVRTIEQRMDRSAEALEEIHGLLDSGQRASVAAALRQRVEEKYQRRADDARHHDRGVRRLASHLMLSTLQIDKLKAMKKELIGEKERLRPSREELLSLIDAFEGDHFRGALNAFRAKKSVVLRAHMARAGERTDSVLSILTPAQRDLLADLIKDGPRKVLLGEPEPE